MNTIYLRDIPLDILLDRAFPDCCVFRRCCDRWDLYDSDEAFISDRIIASQERGEEYPDFVRRSLLVLIEHEIKDGFSETWLNVTMLNHELKQLHETP